MFCSKCGAELAEGFEFCMKCGTRVTQPMVETDAAVPIPETPVAVPVAPEELPVTKKSKKPLFIALGAAAAAAVIAVVLIFVFMGGEKGYFADIPWGTPVETVEQLVRERLNCVKGPIYYSGQNVIALKYDDFEGIHGVVAGGGLYLDDKQCLNNVALSLEYDDDCVYDGNWLFEEIRRIYDERYGEDNRVPISDPVYIWLTPESLIRVYEVGDSVFVDFRKIEEYRVVQF